MHKILVAAGGLRLIAAETPVRHCAWAGAGVAAESRATARNLAAAYVQEETLINLPGFIPVLNNR